MDEYKAKLDNIISSKFATNNKSLEGLGELHELIEHIARSFGGCTKCWGKGYASQLEVLSWHGGESETNRKVFCDCARGKQLKSYEDA